MACHWTWHSVQRLSEKCHPKKGRRQMMPSCCSCTEVAWDGGLKGWALRRGSTCTLLRPSSRSEFLPLLHMMHRMMHAAAQSQRCSPASGCICAQLLPPSRGCCPNAAFVAQHCMAERLQSASSMPVRKHYSCATAEVSLSAAAKRQLFISYLTSRSHFSLVGDTKTSIKGN